MPGKNSRHEPRANKFVLESLEPRVMLSATPMTAAVVTTDHLDYAPGETAVITTSNTNGDGLQFGAGELVQFQVSRTDGMADAPGSTAGMGPAGNEAWYVVDGVGGFTAHLGSDVSGDGVADWIAPDNDLTVNGSISTTWFVEEQYRNSSLVVTAQGQESGAVATQAFTDANINTTTVLTSNVATTIYGSQVKLTATVTAAVGNVDPVGSVEFFDGDTSLGINSVSSGGAADGVVSYSINSLTLSAGTHQIHAVFTGGPVGADNFNNSSSNILPHEVTQKSLRGDVTVANKVYDGTTVATVTTTTLNGVELFDIGNVALDGTANFATANVGVNQTVTFSITGTGLTGSAASNYTLGVVRDAQADITPATVVVSNYTGTYDGLAHGAVVLDPFGNPLGGLSMVTHTDVGSYTESWTFANANYVAASGTNNITITKANVTVVTSGYNGVYDGAAHTATATATGRLGESLSGLVLNATPHSNAGIYSDSGTFTDSTGNYNSTSGSVISSITKANATVTLVCYVGIYDGVAHQATGTATGVLGESLAGLNLSSTAHSNAGTYTDTVTFTDVTGNYKNTVKNVKSTIAKANATITVSGYVGTYDGAAHQATGTATGVLGEDLSAGLNLSSTSHTNAGTYTDVATFTGETNYKDTIKNVKSTIYKANATITVTGYSATFDGAAHTATGTAIGVNGEDLSAGLDLSSTTHTNSGTYTDIVTFTDVTGNYKDTIKNVRSRII